KGGENEETACEPPVTATYQPGCRSGKRTSGKYTSLTVLLGGGQVGSGHGNRPFGAVASRRRTARRARNRHVGRPVRLLWRGWIHRRTASCGGPGRGRTGGPGASLRG